MATSITGSPALKAGDELPCACHDFTSCSVSLKPMKLASPYVVCGVRELPSGDSGLAFYSDVSVLNS